MHHILEGVFLAVLSLLLLLFFVDNWVADWICAAGFTGGIGLIVYGVGEIRSARRFLHYAQSIEGHLDELKSRLGAGESIDAIAKDLHARHNVPERASILLGLLAARDWLESGDPERQPLARRCIEAQVRDANEPPDAYLDRLSEEGSAIYLDETALCGTEPPGSRWIIDNATLRAHDPMSPQPACAGSLLLTPAYLYFLSSRSDRHWWQRSSAVETVVGIALLPVAAAAMIAFSVLSLLPGYTQAVTGAVGLGGLFLKPFGPRKIRSLKRAFGNAGSFAIPLADIVSLAPSGTSHPRLLVTYVGSDGAWQQRWFHSSSYLNEGETSFDDFRPEEAKAEDSAKGWLAGWQRRISLVALAEGKVLDEQKSAAAMTSLIAKQHDLWNRGRPSPHEATQSQTMRAQNSFGKLLVALPIAAVSWGVPFVVAGLMLVSFITLVDSGALPQLGFMKVVIAIAFIALVVNVGATPVVIAAFVTPYVMRRLYPAPDAGNPHFKWGVPITYWQTGPQRLLQGNVHHTVDILRREDGLATLTERDERTYRTPPIYTRMAVLELICGMAQSGVSETRALARKLATNVDAGPVPDVPTALAQLSSNGNLYFLGIGLRLGAGAAPPDAALPGILAVGIQYLFFVPLVDAEPPPGFGEHKLTPADCDWLSDTYDRNGGSAIRLREISAIDLSPVASFDDRRRQSMAVEIKTACEDDRALSAGAYRIWVPERQASSSGTWLSGKEAASTQIETQLREVAVLWMARLQLAAAGVHNLLVTPISGLRVIRLDDAYPGDHVAGGSGLTSAA
jgi:hypothetical protein